LVKQEDEQYRQQKANHSVVGGGMLSCTATDMAVLCGGNREVCYTKVLVTDMDPDELLSDLLTLRRLYCLLMNNEGVLSMNFLEVNLASIEPGTIMTVNKLVLLIPFKVMPKKKVLDARHGELCGCLFCNTNTSADVCDECLAQRYYCPTQLQSEAVHLTSHLQNAFMESKSFRDDIYGSLFQQTGSVETRATTSAEENLTMFCHHQHAVHALPIEMLEAVLQDPLLVNFLNLLLHKLKMFSDDNLPQSTYTHTEEI
nr:probable tRNA (guanine(26)-N(2))-dimethyltransferase 2 [Tanacetum cinerariifolium]